MQQPANHNTNNNNTTQPFKKAKQRLASSIDELAVHDPL
jgi:hypothetical protein